MREAQTHTRPQETPNAHQMQWALDTAADWYHHQLLHSPHAEPDRQYLHQRGFTQNDWIEWRLGWGTTNPQGPHPTIGTTSLTTQTGITAHTRAGRLYDPMTNRVVFPGPVKSSV